MSVGRDAAMAGVGWRLEGDDDLWSGGPHWPLGPSAAAWRVELLERVGRSFDRYAAGERALPTYDYE